MRTEPQRALFEKQEDPPGPLNRKGETTSRLAAKDHVRRGRYAAHMAICLSYVERFDHQTSNELKVIAIREGRADLAEVFHRRLPDLEKRGLVKRDPVHRKCSISGKECLTWTAIKK